jgi:exodeoxyribonuclease V alpha subunit
VKCLLAAPTGRAARRLAEVALEPAVTIHRMLGYNSKRNSFTFNRSNPVDADIILIDEVSMLELTLAHRLFDAVPDHCTVVMIGDVDQLPAVGPGMVLSDLIQSQQVSVITLDTVFRQGENSQIISNSHRIRKGESPVFPPNKEADSFLMPIPRIKKDKTKRSVEDMAWLHEKLARLVSVNLPERVKNGFAPLDPIRDIQVLAPMRKGEAGINELNKTLQQALNPHGLPFEARGRNFRVGDRVMQSKNNYELDISNGDIGFILGFDKDDQEIHIDFYGRTVVIPYREANELELAYAQTIHKAQGSEYPVVIVVVSWAHNIMLQRNLLYTANTRAKRMALFIASKGAIGKAVENCDVKKRYTFLRQRLRQGSAVAV